MHAFRAFAILNIVAIHALAGWLYFSGPVVLADSTLESISRLVELLFHESTIYFALISGLLYSLVLHRRGVASFARGKALNVLVPYALLTALFTALDWNSTQG